MCTDKICGVVLPHGKWLQLLHNESSLNPLAIGSLRPTGCTILPHFQGWGQVAEAGEGRGIPGTLVAVAAAREQRGEQLLDQETKGHGLIPQGLHVPIGCWLDSLALDDSLLVNDSMNKRQAIKLLVKIGVQKINISLGIHSIFSSLSST